jgi:hypothetical protein
MEYIVVVIQNLGLVTVARRDEGRGVPVSDGLK